MRSNGTFDYGTNGKFLTSDGAGNYYLYDKDGAITQGGGLFKSAMAARRSRLFRRRNRDGKPICHLQREYLSCFGLHARLPKYSFLCARERLQPEGLYASTPLRVSFDAGVHWASVSTTFQVWQVAFGKAKPGNTYPAIYITGNTADWPNP